MHENKTAAPGGHPDAANDSIAAEKVYLSTGPSKDGRRRYVRLFPERLYFLFARLSDRELAGYLRFLAEYAVSSSAPLDDGQVLARITGLGRNAWPRLRAKLIELGLVQVTEGRLVDSDQQQNLDIQRRTSERQRARALSRWEAR